ncbi:MAG: MFS transporter, partial [Oscillospiraceae bacterium]|nr:MFS transporter [Oscillospiraceae bacterium]
MKDTGTFHAKTALVASCLMLCMWVGLWWNCVTLYGDPIIQEWGITRTQFMMVATIMALTNAVVQMFFYGKIQSKLGIRRYIMLGGIVCTCGIAMIAVSHGLILFYLGAFLFGSMIGGITNNPVTEILNSWYKKNVGRLVGITQTASSIAGIIFSLVIATLVRVAGWRVPVWITAIASALTTITVLALYKGSPEELGEKPMYADEQKEIGVEEDGVAYKQIFKTPQFYS